MTSCSVSASNRAGRADSALQVWQQALAHDPDHAETLEQLALAYTKRNRLVEAASLYERLARQPGWELPGELSLAGLRAELGDPAGAARVLEQALNRESAGSLDPEAHARYRKLLARVLLRTGKASNARLALTGLLERGTDREASWLLSRALLQEGALTPASLALDHSGSYRSENPLELEPSPYVGESQCAECHRDIFRAYQASRFTTTLLRGKQLLELPYPDKPTPDPADPAVVHRFQKTEEVVQVETRVNEKIFRAVVDYAFGSPDRYVSLVGHDAIRPVVYSAAFALPGRSRPGRLGAHHRPHIRRRRRARLPGQTARCRRRRAQVPLLPHDKRPCGAVENRSGSHRSGDRLRALSRSRRQSPQSRRRQVLRPGDRQPGAGVGRGKPATLRPVPCLARQPEPSQNRSVLDSISGHDASLEPVLYRERRGLRLRHLPRPPSQRRAFRRLLRSEVPVVPFHGFGLGDPVENPRSQKPAAIRQGSTCPINASSKCLACHMPPFRSEPLHATFTDHYIRVHEDMKPVGR